ncbi:hypothetical protein EDC94DRAFT_655976 [Helicostylum pulchrum]|nr:hypothetical protein EDC94DRAFT_655976 [Helicostylum pulchrum]
MSTITIIAIISLLETIVTILRIAIIANGVALILAHFNLDTSDKKSHTDKSPTNEERCMKREATDTESCYPAKRAKWLPFFSLRPFVLKRKIPDCEEEPAA